MTDPDRTHDSAIRSWIDSANDLNTDFPIQNLPLGVFRRPEPAATARIGAAIGDSVVDLTLCARDDLFEPLGPRVRSALGGSTLNELMALGRDAARALRVALVDALRHDADGPRARLEASGAIVAMRDVEPCLPAAIGDYSDFYASIEHATNVGRVFRPDNPLLPNYTWIPIGYHGRASSIVVSGTDVVRPSGQTRDADAAAPRFAPSARLDYELEVGAFIGAGNSLGTRIPIAEAERHLFGAVLLNDWSARDIQTWEYQPLGPFLAKSFATTISPWVVTLDALVPFRTGARRRGEGEPAPLPYLHSADNDVGGGLDLTLEVRISSARMRAEGQTPTLVSRGSFADMYWTLAQLTAHHASNGCNLRPGDLLGSGTVSGASAESRGCLLERTSRGTEPLELPTGEMRRFLEDGDEVVFRGWCERAGFRRIGFGECRGRVVAAV